MLPPLRMPAELIRTSSPPSDSTARATQDSVSVSSERSAVMGMARLADPSARAVQGVLAAAQQRNPAAPF